MSREMLYELNGNRNGKFRRWLDNFNGEPRIAWYPSAGTDFRDMLYLHPAFREISKSSKSSEPPPPDIFLHTDYYPWDSSTFLDTNRIYRDKHTEVTVSHIEALPRCNLPLDARIVHFTEANRATGQIVFLEVNVESDKLGRFTRPLIYAFAENASFCAGKILPNNGRISHIVHVRHGGGCGGGGYSSGIWLLNVLDKVNCEVLIADDDHMGVYSGDERIFELYPELSGKNELLGFEKIRTIEGKYWSEHGDLSWNVRKKRDEEI